MSLVLTGAAVIDYVNATATVTDTTDYVGQGYLLADMLGSVTADNIGGQFYSGTPTDFDGANNILSKVVSIPVIPNTGLIPTGTYTFVITSIVSPDALPQVTATLTLTLSWDFDIPLPDVDISASCINATLTVTDATVLDVVGWTRVSTTRTMTINAPLDPNTNTPVIDPIVTGVSTRVLTYPNVYTGVWVVNLVTDVTYEDANGNQVSVEIVGQNSLKVTCDTSLCCAYTCIQTALLNYRELCKGNNSNKDATNNLLKIVGDYISFSVAQQCGNESGMASALTLMKTDLQVGDCGCCNDKDGSPVQVVPMIPSASGSSICIVDNTDLNLTITSDTVGDTTTYHVNLSTAFLTTIADMATNIATNATLITNLTTTVGAIVSSKYKKLYENDTNVATATNSQEQLGTYTIPANTLAANGDEVVISGDFTNSVADNSTSNIIITMNAHSLGIGTQSFNKNYYQFIVITLCRVSNTSYRLKYQLDMETFFSPLFELKFNTAVSSPGISFSANTIVVQWEATSLTSTSVTLEKSKVELLSK